METTEERLPKPKSVLVQKLSMIMEDAGHIEKSGSNTHQNYKYIKEEDVVAKFRPLFIKHGVFVLSSVKAHTVREVPSSSGTSMFADVVVEYTLLCKDSGEAIKVNAAGTGIDRGDKGLYKALTGANKYFLLKNFSLSGGEDPENEDAESPSDIKSPSDFKSRPPVYVPDYSLPMPNVEARIPNQGTPLDLSSYKPKSGKYMGRTIGSIPADELRQHVEYLSGLEKLGGNSMELLRTAREYLNGLNEDVK